MKAPSRFEEYIRKGVVKKRIPNKPRANDLVLEAERKFDSLRLIIDKIGIRDSNANDIVEYCYDIMINLVRARMLLNGLNSSGKGAHEAEVSYMRNLGISETDIKTANQLRYFRNGIMYYGKRFDLEYAEKVVKFLKKIKKKLEK